MYLWEQGTTPTAFPALKEDRHTEVLVVGGGMAGILCAYMLQQKGIECVLVEAETVGSGVTRGTTAVLTAQHDFLYKDMVNKFGADKSRRYLRANLEAVKKFCDLAKTFPCDLETKASYMYTQNSSEAEILKHEAEIVNKLGFPAEYVRQAGLPFAIKCAVRYPDMAQFHPLKFLYGLAKELNIYEHTLVKKIEKGTAYTTGGNIRAEKIVIATHFPFINGHGLYFAKLYQKRSFVLALENGPDILGTYVDYSKQGMYFRNYGNLLLVGGGDHRTGSKKGGFDYVEAYVRDYFPEYNVKYRWAAQDCMSLDQIAYIGRYSPSLPDVFVATGFNEWGMTTSMIAAEIISDMIAGNKNEYSDVFLPNRSMFHAQLFANAGETIYNYLIPVSRRCTHMGCALKWNAAEHTWDCACHGSRFNERGEPIDNPAVKNLPRGHYNKRV